MRGRISRVLISALSALSSASRLSERGFDTLEALRRTDALAYRLGSRSIYIIYSTIPPHVFIFMWADSAL
jgi:hypothetical protein